jgi:hypothetical protein
LKVTGAVNHPLSLSYDQILKLPSLTEVVLLICPGFFANNGRWTGASLKTLLQEAQVKKEATYLDIKGGKVPRVFLHQSSIVQLDKIERTPFKKVKWTDAKQQLLKNHPCLQYRSEFHLIHFFSKYQKWQHILYYCLENIFLYLN